MKCVTLICESPAVVSFLWPGSTARGACAFCAARAAAIAKAMGFELAVYPLRQAELRAAEESVALLDQLREVVLP